MAQSLQAAPQYGSRSDKQRISEEQLSGAKMNTGNEVAIWSSQVPADKAYHWGYGLPDRDAAAASYVYADLQNNSGSAISGQLVLAVTDSTQEDVLAKRYFQSLEDLRASANDARTERIMMPEMQPGASRDRHLELRVVADASSDGDTLDPAASDVKLNYGSVDR